ncbi:MAG: hypothetical protein ACJ780_27215 [Solirubrobacteraceae bacterium]
MSYAADKEDLARHEAEIAAQQAFNHAVLDEGEPLLLDCVYIDPPAASSPVGTDAVASWRVVDQAVDTELERPIDDFVPRRLPRPADLQQSTTSPDQLAAAALLALREHLRSAGG